MAFTSEITLWTRGPPSGAMTYISRPKGHLVVAEEITGVGERLGVECLRAAWDDLSEGLGVMGESVKA